MYLIFVNKSYSDSDSDSDSAFIHREKGLIRCENYRRECGRPLLVYYGRIFIIFNHKRTRQTW